ncbi:hypothetical protein SJI00_21255 [Pseudomonas sp. RP23018S]|uniref:hypothetical protein n=1 Tax=Pseudomonas sp. RP23018S TaxID=3096037 RepID=UPI002ACAF2B9|nr:hypothetical protein [Pseudomonas sp. RP23018S]MDZ5605306.1 hypothetical protein [Pseudomonas sp. RP23018S]
MKVTKFALAAIIACAATISGCSTVSDLHDKAEAKRANPPSSFVRAHEFESKLDPMGWGESNQNGQ